MTRKITTILVLSLLLFAFLSVTSYGLDRRANHNIKSVGSVAKAKLAGAERGLYYADPDNAQALGFDDVRSASPGLTVGYTTYDYQANGRMNRQIGWRGTEMVHIDWMKQTDSAEGGSRGTGYEAWDPDEAGLVFVGVGGGCDIHPRLGSGVNYSGYVGMDVDTEGKINISNHHDEGAGYASTIWYDFTPGACFFSPYRSRLPDSTMTAVTDCEVQETGACEFIWPNHDYQVWDGDTVTHLFAHEFEDGIEPSMVVYFRRVGSDTVGSWAHPGMLVDTVADIAQYVTSSHVSAKVALVWIGNIPEIQGDPESSTTGSQRNNDAFYMLSDDMGASWGDKHNITRNLENAGWHLHTDISALYGNDDYLHVVWNAREVLPIGTGTYAHFYGCRLWHYSNDPAQASDSIRVIADANWDLPDQDYCHGGAWNEMSITKMTVSECDGKLYTVFTQYNDIYNGIDNDCHEDAFTGGQQSTANGEIYVSISDNGGFNWDIPRNITNSRTPHCDEGVLECDSDVWPSAARFGMQVVDGDFTGVPTADMGVTYTGDYFLDVSFVNDKYGGGCVQDAGQWTYNPVNWIRVPCVEPIPNPVISTSPANIDDPTWTKYGIQLDTVVKVENIGNASLNVTSIVPVYTTTHTGWLGVGDPGPFQVSHLTPNFNEVDVYLNLGGAIGGTTPQRAEGYLEITSDAFNAPVYQLMISLIVADTVQFPEQADIRTDCKRIVWNNAGNIGDGGNYPDGGYNMGFFDDCDTTDNNGGANDNASVYLYDASPFVLRINALGDTVLNYYMFDADWLSNDGFRPQVGLVSDSTTYDDYQYGATGKFTTIDSAISVEVEYFAPTDPDSCSFIVVKQRFYNNTDDELTGVYLGDLFDWDIPGDTGVANGSGFDAPGGEASLDLMYCYGGEYDADSIENDDCVLADDRLGGMAFYDGYKFPYCPDARPNDSLQNPIGPWWTHMNPDWVGPTGGFVGSQLYDKMENMGSVWETWAATGGAGDPDSMFQDLNMVSVFGKFNIGADDTLIFVKILTTTYEGLAGLQSNVVKARQWIADRPGIFSWPDTYQCTCCEDPGDADDNGSVNILDITKLIGYLYQQLPPGPCLSQMDADGNDSINILDITKLIGFLYQQQPPPICGNIDK